MQCGLPVAFADLLGVPVVHANHCGKVQAHNFPAADKIQTRQLVGSTQIAGGNGQAIVRRDFFEGEGFVISDISWDIANRRKGIIYPERYWIPELPDSYLNAWETVNVKGKQYYEAVALPYYKTSCE